MKTVPFLNAKLYQFKMPLTSILISVHDKLPQYSFSSYVQVWTLALHCTATLLSCCDDRVVSSTDRNLEHYSPSMFSTADISSVNTNFSTR